jgi:two-component system, OmpR family, response regulator RegX3
MTAAGEATVGPAAASVARATDRADAQGMREGGFGRPLEWHPGSMPPYDPDVAAGKRRILLVEDEASIVRPLADALGREGFDTRVAGTVEEGIALGRSADPDLVLLDLMLPDGSGFDVCRELRKASDVPIVMLTARGDEADRVVGLELGADDYVVKPFSAREVIARIRAVLRRVAPASEPSGETIQIGDVRLDPARRSVEVAGREVDLARREFELLHRLMLGAGAVITREQLIEDVWDMNWFGSTKTLDVHVSSLRRKLGDDPAEPSYIHTVRGVGFRFSSAREFEG